ncbi:MAG TPA: hypothetical protein VLG39_04275 [Nitrospirota bacterium]|nr:hypothetical protein [Nitrospirota bacterium]
MATVKNTKLYGYCDDINKELARMQARLHELQEEVKTVYGADNELALAHGRHLCELADMIEWKLQILMKACPFEWKGGDKDIERVSVGSTEAEFSGGYIGG